MLCTILDGTVATMQVVDFGQGRFHVFKSRSEAIIEESEALHSMLGVLECGTRS